MIRMPRPFPYMFAGLLGAIGMVLSACGDLIPANPLIPDLRELYARQQFPEGKIPPPILNELTPPDMKTIVPPQLSVLPRWAQGVTPSESPKTYLNRQYQAAQLPDTPTIFPGLSGQFDMIMPATPPNADTASPPAVAQSGAADSFEDLFAQHQPDMDVADNMSAYTQGQPMEAPESADVDINYDALEAAIAALEGRQPDATAMPHLSDRAEPGASAAPATGAQSVEVDMAQLYARRSCPLPGSIDDAYDGFNAETVRFAWEDEPIAAGPRSTMSDMAPAQSDQRNRMGMLARRDTQMPDMSRPEPTAPQQQTAIAPDVAPGRVVSPPAIGPTIDTAFGSRPRAVEPNMMYRVNFDFGSAQVSPKARAILKQVAKNYKRHGGHVRLIGHATAPSNAPSNAPSSASAAGAGGGNLSLTRSLALQSGLLALGVGASDIELVASDRTPASFDSLPNIELEWRPASVSLQQRR